MNAAIHTTKYALQRQEAAWIAARKLDEFTAGQLAAALEVGDETARRRINQWRDEGACELVRVEGRQQVFRLTEAAPEHQPVRGAPRSDEDALWTAMRLLRRFDPNDLVASTTAARPGMSMQIARTYCQFLAKAGYLRCLAPAVMGKREASYALARNTGPLAPRPRRIRVLVDPNEGGIAWTPEVEA